jgi:tRNA-dihydrouridine synthase 1
LNLGCPQRVAHSGHFGSYLLDPEDRPLVLSMVQTLSSNLRIPLFVKIRLLNTLEESIELCQQLVEAGAALIAIHGRYRVNLVGRSGPGARCVWCSVVFYFTLCRCLVNMTIWLVDWFVD